MVRRHESAYTSLSSMRPLPICLNFEPLLRVLRNWTQYILNAFDCKYTNGFTEGCNNKIKMPKRIAFGYRNFTNFRQRILLSFNTP